MIYTFSEAMDIDQLALFHALEDKENSSNDAFPTDEIIEKTKTFYKDKFEEGDLFFILSKDEERANIFTGAISVVRYIGIPTRDNPTGEYACINSLYVIPEYRKKGVGTTLARKMLQECFKRGLKKIILETQDTHRTLYRNLGFSDEDHYMVINLN